jgi:hypothetical protein
MGFNFSVNKKVKPMISTERSQDYSIALLLSIPNKNCESLAEQLGTSGNTMIRILNEPVETLNQSFSQLYRTFALLSRTPVLFKNNQIIDNLKLLIVL